MRQSQCLVISIDVTAILGHTVSEISTLRREQLKGSLNPECHALCSGDVPSTSKLLFGDDLAQQVRDAKETTRLGHTVTSMMETAADTTSTTIGITSLIIIRTGMAMATIMATELGLATASRFFRRAADR